MKKQASQLQNKIQECVVSLYNQLLLEASPLEAMISKIKTYHPKDIKVDQVNLTGIPHWYKFKDDFVEESVVVQLLIANADLKIWGNLTDDSSDVEEVMMSGTGNMSQAQKQTIAHLQHIFYSEYILPSVFIVSV